MFGHLYLYRLWLLYIEHHRTFNKRRVALSNNLTTDMDESIPEPEVRLSFRLVFDTNGCA